MPRVGKKKFPYTKEGVAKAKAYAKENNLPIIYTEDNKAGMSIPSYAEGGGVRFYESQAGAGGGTPALHDNFGGGAMGGGGKGGAQEEAAAEEEYKEPEENEEFTGCGEGQVPDGEGGCKDAEGEEPGEEPGETPCPEGLFRGDSGNCEEPFSPEEERFENKEQEEEFYKDTPESDINAKIIGPEANTQTGGVSGGKLGITKSIADDINPVMKPDGPVKLNIGEKLASKEGGSGISLGDRNSGGNGLNLSSIRDKASGSGGGGGLSSIGDKLSENTSSIGDKLSDVSDSATGKKGMVVKKKTKRKHILSPKKETIMKTRINRKYKAGATIDEGTSFTHYNNKIYESYDEARKAWNSKITNWGENEKQRYFPYYGPVITEGENKGKRLVQQDISTSNPRFSTLNAVNKRNIKKKEISDDPRNQTKETINPDFYKGGGKVKVNKKGIAIIIAVGKPKINRKKQ